MDNESLKYSLNGFASFLGFKLEDVHDDGLTLSAELKPEYMNVQQIPHGGFLTTLLDQTAGMTAFNISKGRRLVTRSCDVHFLKASAESTLYCSSKVLQCGRNTALISAEVKDKAGIIVACGNFEFYFLNS